MTAKATKKDASAEPAAEVDGLSFETALQELETVVSRLEQGQADLDDSIALYERGQVLKSLCEKKLADAECRLEKIVESSPGVASASTVPLD